MFLLFLLPSMGKLSCAFQVLKSFHFCALSDLTTLAKLGVLWLNTSLTVRAHKAGSHSGKGWETFTAKALKAVVSRPGSNGVVFMAWGLPAQKTCEKIGIDKVRVTDP